ncbi:MAG: hypothetical protein AAF919_19145 [Pseudomonadota bacterium]
MRYLLLLLTMVLAACNGGADRPSARLGDLDDPAALRAAIAGRTFVSFSQGHGTFVEYFAPDGLAVLWHPEDTRPNSGQWRVEMDRRDGTSSVVCLFFGNGSFNPATGVGGGRTCITGVRFQAGQRDVLEGDPFDLSSGNVPFVMRKGRDYSVSELRRGRR